MWSKKIVSDEEIIKAANSNLSMSAAAASVKLKLSTFKRRAEKLGVYVPNQGGIGLPRKGRPCKTKIPLHEILDGKHPQYNCTLLKKRLFKSNIKKNICEECKITEWNGKEIVCELHHINGDRTDHVLKNLQILCPNCHSQTNNFSLIKNRMSNKEKEEKLKMLNKFGSRSDYSFAVKTKWDESQQKYIPLILNSDIDFTKFGWVSEVAKILDRPPQKVNIWMKRIMPEFYMACYKRKNK